MTMILPIFQSPFFAVGFAGVTTVSIRSAWMGVGESVQEGWKSSEYEESDKELFHRYGGNKINILHKHFEKSHNDNYNRIYFYR